MSTEAESIVNEFCKVGARLNLDEIEKEIKALSKGTPAVQSGG